MIVGTWNLAEGGTRVEDMGSCSLVGWKELLYCSTLVTRASEDFECESNVSVAVEDGTGRMLAFAHRQSPSPNREVQHVAMRSVGCGEAMVLRSGHAVTPLRGLTSTR